MGPGFKRESEKIGAAELHPGQIEREQRALLIALQTVVIIISQA